MNSANGAGSTDSYVAYPDEVLRGTWYRLPTLPILDGKMIKHGLFHFFFLIFAIIDRYLIVIIELHESSACQSVTCMFESR